MANSLGRWSSRSRVLSRVLVLCVVALAASSCRRAPATACSDVWKSDDFQSAHVEVVGCSTRSDLQGAPFVSRYRVAGRYASDAEQSLIKDFSIKPLQRTCCLWESTDNAQRDANGKSLSITMASEETTVTDRREWAKIPYFYIEIKRYDREP